MSEKVEAEEKKEVLEGETPEAQTLRLKAEAYDCIAEIEAYQRRVESLKQRLLGVNQKIALLQTN